MRHSKTGRCLGRDSSHRKAMFYNLSKSVIEHELVKTTVAKAKELRSYLEPLVTLAKEDTVSNRRLAFSKLRDKKSVGKLFVELGPRFKNRPGGYLQILKCGYRNGDSAPMAIVKLVENAAE